MHHDNQIDIKKIGVFIEIVNCGTVKACLCRKVQEVRPYDHLKKFKTLMDISGTLLLPGQSVGWYFMIWMEDRMIIEHYYRLMLSILWYTSVKGLHSDADA